MASARFVLHGFIELVIIIAIYPRDGTGYEQIASINDTNVDLVFEFNKTWKARILCTSSTKIGECDVHFGSFYDCYTDDSAVYRLSANVSRMVMLTLRIILFNESMKGNYSCYDRYNYKGQFIVMSTPVNLTSVIMNPNVHTFPKYSETSIYTCITSTTKPRAVIHWFEEGRNITDMSNSTYDSSVSTSVIKYLPNVKGEANVSCVAIYKYREHHISITKATKVFVQFPVSTPTVSVNDVNVSSTIAVLEGDTVRFQCIAEGFPPPAYNWNFKGHLTDGHILELNIKRTENGNALRCSVSNVLLTINGSKTATSFTHWAEIILHVLYKPDKPTVLVKTCNNTSVHLNGSLTLLEGDSFEMSCTAIGYPIPSVRWIPHLDGYENILRSYRVSYKQRGTYTCVSENVMNITATGEIVGRNNVTVLLDIRALPNAPEQTHVVVDSITENSVRIEWVLSNNGDDPDTITLLWQMENMLYWNAVPIPSDTTSFHLQGLAPGKKYKVKLMAENIAGKSNETDIIVFETDDSGHFASIVGGVIGGAFGLFIFCSLTFVIYRKYLMNRDKQPLPENAYEDLAKTRRSDRQTDSAITICPPSGA